MARAKLSYDTFMMLFDQHHRNFKDVNLSRINFSRFDFNTPIFIGADLRGATLTEANLKRADSRQAKLDREAFYALYQHGHRDFTAVSFIGTDFSGLNLNQVNLSCSDLRKTNFTGAQNVLTVDIQHAYLNVTAFLSLYNEGRRCFKNTTLCNVNIAGLDLRETDIEGMYFQSVTGL